MTSQGDTTSMIPPIPTTATQLSGMRGSGSSAASLTLSTSSAVSTLQPPFKSGIESLLDNVTPPSSTSSSPRADWKCHLPATYHDSSHTTRNVRSDVTRFVFDELDLSRLMKISGYLWLAGIKGHARALSRQVVMNRTIVATEQIDMHLVWYENTIYVKPLPAWLLSHSFWNQHLCQSHGNRTEKVYGEALGFLVSYSWLVCSPNDFHIAQGLHLLPEQVTYECWTLFMDAITRPEVVSTSIVSPRYHFGELRLQRLNKIYRYAPHLHMNHFVRGYFYLHRTYSSFYAREFGWIAITVFAYVTIVLSAMQVGLSTALAENYVFSKASEWFAVVSLLLPPAVIVLALLSGAFFVLNNLCFTVVVLRKKRERGTRTAGKRDDEV